MKHEFYEFIQSIAGYLWFVLLAAMGGAVNYISRIKRDPDSSFKLSEFIGELAISSFGGLITMYICIGFDLHPALTAAACGIAGHMGGRCMYMIEGYVQRGVDRLLGK